MSATDTMSKSKPKRPGGDEPKPTKQINVRVPTDLAERIEKAADMLATDASHLLRMMIAEKLPEYEERARRARGINPENN